MRIVFFGTPDDAVPALCALHDAGHEIALVVTQPDRRRSRRGEPEPSPVKRAATELGLPVRTPAKSREVADEVASSGATVGVVVAFGQLLPASVFDALPFGLVNVHFSLLPRWRGAAPVERAMLAGDEQTGVCLMRIEAGLDTGPVFACRSTPIGAEETAGELRARLVDLGAALLLQELPGIPGREPVPQSGEPTYAEKLTVDEFRIDPARPAAELDRVVRAGNPRPGAWLMVDGERVKVWRAHVEPSGGTTSPDALDTHARLATGSGVLVLDEVQPQGRRPMSAQAWLAGRRGAPLRVG
ncbi:MAG: methionyl-tRNA formyltransferase [Actinobacteria bacterium]|nr:methionyl-tRNA formyltransferase [Actinomycetota bacterium]